MAVTFHALATGAVPSATCPAPAISDGDVLVAAVSLFATTTVPPAPVGWNRVVNFALDPDALGVYWRYVPTAGSEPSSYSWSTTDFCSIAIGSYTGADPANPWDTQGANTGTSASNPSVTVARDGSFAVWCESADHVFASGEQPAGFLFRYGADGLLYSDKTINAGASGAFTGGVTGIVAIGIIQPPAGGAQLVNRSTTFGAGTILMPNSRVLT